MGLGMLHTIYMIININNSFGENSTMNRNNTMSHDIITIGTIN